LIVCRDRARRDRHRRWINAACEPLSRDGSRDRADLRTSSSTEICVDMASWTALVTTTNPGTGAGRGDAGRAVRMPVAAMPVAWIDDLGANESIGFPL
jgi:hypothetical protein